MVTLAVVFYVSSAVERNCLLHRCNYYDAEALEESNGARDESRIGRSAKEDVWCAGQGKRT
jgi:hypothetical protein